MTSLLPAETKRSGRLIISTCSRWRNGKRLSWRYAKPQTLVFAHALLLSNLKLNYFSLMPYRLNMNVKLAVKSLK
jgi:hypothetical protein